jgi:hypothetical protein
MARSIEEIYESIVNEISGYSILNGLVKVPEDFGTFREKVENSSKLDIGRQLIYGVAYAIHTLETIFDTHRKEVQLIADTAVPQTDRWVRDMTLKFQYGDELKWVGDRYDYEQIDETKRLVKQCAVLTQRGRALIKVSKGEVGSLEPLSDEEQNALIEYWKLLRPVGTDFNVVSATADDLKVKLTIYRDPLVLNRDGTLRSDNSTMPVENAIDNYLQLLPFNGRFWSDQLVDAVQAAQGVQAVDLDEVSAKYGSLDYSVITTGFYDSFAGYMKLDSDPTESEIVYK